MHGERRALYNALRMKWLNNHDQSVQGWEVEDYRQLPLEELFKRLEKRQVFLDQPHFVEMAQDYEGPEELTEALVSDRVDQKIWDAVYLVVFELWRRLLPEKLCLSIFCDELDHQIYLYDQGLLEDPEHLQDALAQLQVVLEEEADEGEDPVELFSEISAACANDLESFLYEYITDQLDQHNFHYASELLDAFGDYVEDVKWFDFLRARLIAQSDEQGARHLTRQVLQYAYDEKDLAFNLELLHFLIREGEDREFLDLVEETLPLLKTEEDFQDLLTLCADFCEFRDRESLEQQVQQLLKSRAQYPLDQPFNLKDPTLSTLLSLLH